MGVSTDAILCYGIDFEEDHEFPWGSGDAEDWFMSEINGFKHSVEIYSREDPSGYAGGNRPSQNVIDNYYKEYTEFKKSHPMPFRVVEHCHAEYPMYILAVPSTCITASRGYPKEIESFTVLGQDYDAFVSFLQIHGIAQDVHPKWLLASYWG